MSEENLAVARGLEEAFKRDDVDWIFEHVAEEIEFFPQRAATEGSFHGHAGIRRFLDDNEESFDVFDPSVTEWHTSGDHVVGIGTIRIRGKGSGIETEVPTASVMTIRDGLIVRWRDYVDRDKALEAAGLS
jgi:ketosteroid isomerase-like protein